MLFNLPLKTSHGSYSNPGLSNFYLNKRGYQGQVGYKPKPPHMVKRLAPPFNKSLDALDVENGDSATFLNFYSLP